MFDAISPPTASEGQPQTPTPAEPPLLHLIGVSKRFGGLPAVDNLSVAVRRGEVLGIIGPNGAGKSTLVNLIGGALAPTAGTVLYQGQDISRLPAHRRAWLGIARTFQVTQPFAGLDIRDNVVIGALFGRQRLRRAAALLLTWPTGFKGRFAWIRPPPGDYRTASAHSTGPIGSKWPKPAGSCASPS